MTRYAKRTDENHSDVVEEFRHALPEATVFDASGTGAGFPDLVVGWRGRNYLFEIKDPLKPQSKRSLTGAQETFHCSWQGQVSIVHSAAEMIAVIAKIHTKNNKQLII
jgi:hypothetical protein